MREDVHQENLICLEITNRSVFIEGFRAFWIARAVHKTKCGGNQALCHLRAPGMRRVMDAEVPQQGPLCIGAYVS